LKKISLFLSQSKVHHSMNIEKESPISEQPTITPAIRIKKKYKKHKIANLENRPITKVSPEMK
jgi:hypothetical protein